MIFWGYSYVFKKYLPDFDSYSGDYAGIKKVLDQAIGNLKKDVEVASSAAQWKRGKKTWKIEKKQKFKKKKTTRFFSFFFNNYFFKMMKNGFFGIFYQKKRLYFNI